MPVASFSSTSLYKVAPPGERQQLFHVLKTKKSFFRKPSCFLTAVQTLWKIDCKNVILSFKDMFDVLTVLLQNAFEMTSPFTWKIFCHASLHKKTQLVTLTSTKFAAVQADRGRPLSSRLLIHCWCRFYSAVWSDWFCSTSYAEIPVAVVESEIRVAYFSQVSPLCVIKSMNIE